MTEIIVLSNFSRLMMVKYADKGLMVKGKVSKLFEALYFTGAGFFTTFTAINFLGKYLSMKNQKLTVFEDLCISDDEQTQDVSGKLALVGITLELLSLIMLPGMFLNIRKYVKARSKNGKTPPAIFGRYQQNLVTLKQTLLLHLVSGTSWLILAIGMLLSFKIGYKSEATKMAVVAFTLAINFVLLWIFPLLLIRNIQNKIPSLLKKPKLAAVQPSKANTEESSFYVRQPVIEPRRDFTKIEEQYWAKPRRSSKRKIEEICSVLRFQYEDSRILRIEEL